MDEATANDQRPEVTSYEAPEVTSVTEVGDALIGIEFGSLPGR